MPKEECFRNMEDGLLTEAVRLTAPSTMPSTCGGVIPWWRQTFCVKSLDYGSPVSFDRLRGPCATRGVDSKRGTLCSLMVRFIT